MPNRMPDTPFMIGANGMIADVSFNGFAQGYATVGQQPVIATGETPNLGNAPSPGPWGVTQLLPGSLVQLTGGGEYDLVSGASAFQGVGSGNPEPSVLSGIRGSIQVDLVTGAAGTVQGLAFMVGDVGPTTMYAGISLDTSNRPTFAITDNTGAVKAQGAPSGSAIASGTPLQLRLFWDSTGLLLSAYTAFLINGTPQAVGAVSSAWASFSPVAVLYGRGAQGFSTYTTFLGRFNKVQAGNSPIPTNSQIIPSRTSP